jgi:predicted transcriptional regulator
MGCDEIAAVLNVRTKRVFRALSDLMAAGRVTRYGEPRMYRYGLPIRIAKRERLDNVQVVAM